jgi:hypothetical protein
LLFRLLMNAGDSSPWWSVQTEGLDTNLRGVSVRSDRGSSKPGLHYIVWASGSNGVILRSVNDGKTWKQLAVAGGGWLDFRDIEAFDADVAYVLSSGPGNKSRIYKRAARSLTNARRTHSSTSPLLTRFAVLAGNTSRMVRRISGRVSPFRRNCDSGTLKQNSISGR